MAMIKCPDCKTPISDTAECCPRCGCKFRADYERMQRLRQQIFELENDRSPRPAEPSGGIGGCAIVSILFLIAAVAVVIYGFVLLNMNDGGMVLLGLLVIAGGGYAAFWGFGMTFGFISSDLERNKRSRGEVAYFDRQQAERPERIARMKRELAQLEAKFR